MTAPRTAPAPAPVRLAVVSAGLGVPSRTRLLADRITASVRGELASRERPVEVTVVELRDLAVPIAHHLVTGFPPPRTVPTAVYAASGDWGGAGDALTEDLPARIGRAARELAVLLDGPAADRAPQPDPADLFA
ncbi:hypothetical protein [Streptomyces sp. NPDC047999]|uniref:hypothetical protein n=1 Tax=Streptomyces sp. NPDC047999 TaxID=3365497 RepID=UPI003713DF53